MWQPTATAIYLLSRLNKPQGDFSSSVSSSNNICSPSCNRPCLNSMSVCDNGNEPIYMTPHFTAEKQNASPPSVQSNHITNAPRRVLTSLQYPLPQAVFHHWRVERNDTQCCWQRYKSGMPRLVQSSSSHSCTCYRFAFTTKSTRKWSHYSTP